MLPEQKAERTPEEIDANTPSWTLVFAELQRSASASLCIHIYTVTYSTFAPGNCPPGTDTVLYYWLLNSSRAPWQCLFKGKAIFFAQFSHPCPGLKPAKFELEVSLKVLSVSVSLSVCYNIISVFLPIFRWKPEVVWSKIVQKYPWMLGFCNCLVLWFLHRWRLCSLLVSWGHCLMHNYLFFLYRSSS